MSHNHPITLNYIESRLFRISFPSNMKWVFSSRLGNLQPYKFSDFFNSRYVTTNIYFYIIPILDDVSRLLFFLFLFACSHPFTWRRINVRTRCCTLLNIMSRVCSLIYDYYYCNCVCCYYNMLWWINVVNYSVFICRLYILKLFIATKMLMWYLQV